MTEADINKLSFLEAAGQLVMPRIDFNLDGYFEQALRFVEKYSVGGFIIFNGEISQVRDTVLKLREKSKFPLFFGIDAERGLGQMVKGGTRFPFLMSQGASANSELVKKQAVNTAREMKYCGLNLLFGPVIDINTNPSNPIVNVRSFGDDPELVSRLGIEFSDALRDENIFACGKHFPGHGSTDTDSHEVLPVIQKSEEELLSLELIPFREVIDSGIDFIMAGHLAVSRIDNNMPATISKPLITGILREKLGFEKVVITDSFRMDALREIGSEDKVAAMSLKAGCDIILDPLEGELLVEKLAFLFEKDPGFFVMAKSSVSKLFELKNTIKPLSDVFPEELQSQQLVSHIARNSVCLVKGEAACGKKVDVNIFDVTDGGETICYPFIKRLKQNGVGINSINYFRENTGFLNKNRLDTINIVITTVSAWTRKSQLTENFKNALNDIMDQGDRNNILISFGSPYVIKEFLDYNTIISSFEAIEPCQVETADVLAGLRVPDSKLPIKF